MECNGKNYVLKWQEYFSQKRKKTDGLLLE
jgi:hypothetical protein